MRDQIIWKLERQGEAGKIGSADASLFCSMNDSNALSVLQGEQVGDLTSSIRGIVVNDEQVIFRTNVKYRIDDGYDILLFIVSGYDDQLFQ